MKNLSWLIGLLITIAAMVAYQHPQKQLVERREHTAEEKDQGAENKPCRLVIDSGLFENPSEQPVEVIAGPEDQWAVMKVNLDSFQGVRIRVRYGEDDAPGPWSLNIGDSRTNNGYGGDSGTQTHDSEIQINGDTMSIWGSDVMELKEDRCLRTVDDFVGRGQSVEFQITNERVEWTSPQGKGELESPFLFALQGQPDREGPVNRDIYVGVNRVVAGTSRAGHGAASVEIECF